MPKHGVARRCQGTDRDAAGRLPQLPPGLRLEPSRASCSPLSLSGSQMHTHTHSLSVSYSLVLTLTLSHITVFLMEWADQDMMATNPHMNRGALVDTQVASVVVVPTATWPLSGHPDRAVTPLAGCGAATGSQGERIGTRPSAGRRGHAGLVFPEGEVDAPPFRSPPFRPSGPRATLGKHHSCGLLVCTFCPQ
jgi:hypothetical protein